MSVYDYLNKSEPTYEIYPRRFIPKINYSFPDALIFEDSFEIKQIGLLTTLNLFCRNCRMQFNYLYKEEKNTFPLLCSKPKMIKIANYHTMTFKHLLGCKDCGEYALSEDQELKSVYDL